MSTGFKGVSAGQDSRFTDKEKKLLKSMKFPKEFEQKADLSKVKWDVIKPWIAKRVTELLGVEDDVLIGYIYEQLDAKVWDPRILQINLTGFLEKNTSLFCKELWGLLVSAASTPSGIPQKLLDEKAEELRKKKEMEDQINERLKASKEKAAAEAREAQQARAAERGPDRDVARPRPDERDADRRRLDREQRAGAGRRSASPPRRRPLSPRRLEDRDRARDRDAYRPREPYRGRERSPLLKRSRYDRSRSPDARLRARSPADTRERARPAERKRERSLSASPEGQHDARDRYRHGDRRDAAKDKTKDKGDAVNGDAKPSDRDGDMVDASQLPLPPPPLIVKVEHAVNDDKLDIDGSGEDDKSKGEQAHTQDAAVRDAEKPQKKDKDKRKKHKKEKKSKSKKSKKEKKRERSGSPNSDSGSEPDPPHAKPIAGEGSPSLDQLRKLALKASKSKAKAE
ncbi:hypothetical protein WJX72_000810 [[Myrmecia] bisecta]|uniref:PWI domain-containing protein n=1 Tax=[Myrmecia] bisecta TaxID=41462 RepID=A0AAW1R4C0_9CHLO